jgi:hypothetical protein
MQQDLVPTVPVTFCQITTCSVFGIFLEKDVININYHHLFLFFCFFLICRLAMHYILYLLSKEVLILIASEHSGAPYEKCQERCQSTEVDSNVLFGI